MTEERKRRRRRGRRGGQGRPQDAPDSAGVGEAQPAPPSDAPAGASDQAVDRARTPRRDTRRGRGGAPSPDEGPPSPTNPGIRRAPSAGERGRARAERDPHDREARERGRPSREPRDGRERSRRDGPSRPFEAPPPQDPMSIELGAKFREAQNAVRDARKMLDKRRAEAGDEPDWMIEQLADAERRFEEASTAWVDHLSATGRKMARR